VPCRLGRRSVKAAAETSAMAREGRHLSVAGSLEADLNASRSEISENGDDWRWSFESAR
jgi:hypothetical protein